MPWPPLSRCWLVVFCLLLVLPGKVQSQLSPPDPMPLGVLVGKCRTIHVLEVVAVAADSVSFRTKAVLKGRKEEVPFRTIEEGKILEASQFRKQDLVICFHLPKPAPHPGQVETFVDLLYIQDHWGMAVDPTAREESAWEWSLPEAYQAIYWGSAEALGDHVAAIVAGRETTIAARMPRWRDSVGPARLWRIRAGPEVRHFALTSAAPCFVGWGRGEPEEVADLIRLVSDPRTSGQRVAAFSDLGWLGTAAEPAVPVLRQVLKEQNPQEKSPPQDVKSLQEPEGIGSRLRPTAALALARIGHQEEVLDLAGRWLASKDKEDRLDAIEILGALGPAARSLLPSLLELLNDPDDELRGRAMTRLGRIVTTPAERRAVALALARSPLPASQKYGYPLIYDILQILGPEETVALVPEVKQIKDRRATLGALAFGLAEEIDPTPVRILADLAGDANFPDLFRRGAISALGRQGPRAWPAVPTLRKVLLHPDVRVASSFDGASDFVLRTAKALLDIDPQGSPAFVKPVLREFQRDHGPGDMTSSLALLARCGPVDQESVRLSVDAFSGDPHPEYASALVPSLSPEHRDLLLKIRPMLGGRGYELTLAQALLQLGEKREALAVAGRLAQSGSHPERIQAIRWLSQRRGDAKPEVPALRAALARTRGLEWANLVVALWRIEGGQEKETRRQVFERFDEILEEPQDYWTGEAKIGVYSSSGHEAIFRADVEAFRDAVAVVLARMPKEEEPGEVLVGLLGDRDPHVRLVAALALARVDPHHHDLVPTLQRLLEKNPHFLCYLEDTLLRLGPAAAPVAPLLLPYLNHTPGWGQPSSASRVLRRIDPKLLAANGWGPSSASDGRPTDPEALWNDLNGDDPWKADLAAWRLAGAGAKGVDFLRPRLRPPPILEEGRVTMLIADLDSEDFGVRQRASAELARGVESAAPQLRKALEEKPSLEVKRRIDELLVLTDDNRPPEKRDRLEALRVLEAMGDDEARVLLRDLARGDARLNLTRVAKAALGRLGEW